MDSAAVRLQSTAATRTTTPIALVERAQGGDQLAFARIYLGLRERILRIAYRMLGDRHDAEDVLQETFLKAFRHLPKLGDCAAFEPWIVRIARNSAHNRLRARARCQASARAHDDGADASPTLPRVLSRSGAAEASPPAIAALRAEFRALPREVRATVILHYVRGRSCKEIAARLGVSLSCVKTRLHRARRRLRDAVDPGAADRVISQSSRRR